MWKSAGGSNHLKHDLKGQYQNRPNISKLLGGGQYKSEPNLTALRLCPTTGFSIETLLPVS